MNNKVIPHIQRQYLNPSHPIAFSSPGAIRRFYMKRNKKIPITVAKEALKEVDSYQLHKEFRKPKITNPFFIYNLRDQIQMDLIDVRSLSDFNNGVNHLLTVIDCFSRKAWVEPMKNKNARSSLRAIQKVLRQIIPLPKSILFDKGSEFINKQVQEFLRNKQIHLIHPNSEKKAAIVERFNRSIQDLIYRYMTENETFKYITVLQDLVHAYNNRGHRTLKYKTPNYAEKRGNRDEIFNALNEHYTKCVEEKKEPKYKVGQKVKIKTWPGRFARGYHERWVREHFEIFKINTKMPIPMYIVKSLNNGEVVKGGFYESELQVSINIQ
jgi:Integrase core domain